MIWIFIIILSITLLLNYAMVTRGKQCDQTIQEIKQQQEFDDLLDIYTDVPDIFKQYYIENNYGTLDQVTSGLFEDPNLRLTNA